MAFLAQDRTFWSLVGLFVALWLIHRAVIWKYFNDPDVMLRSLRQMTSVLGGLHGLSTDPLKNGWWYLARTLFWSRGAVLLLMFLSLVMNMIRYAKS